MANNHYSVISKGPACGRLARRWCLRKISFGVVPKIVAPFDCDRNSNWSFAYQTARRIGGGDQWTVAEYLL